jgi:alkylhydroperoxidase family enzyme
MVNGRGAVPDAAFDAMSAHFSPAEIVEIAALVGIMELASALSAVFELQPD